jgi:hypothetical protein
MQTNLYVSSKDENPSLFNVFNPNIYRGPTQSDGFMMPLFYLDEHGQVSSQDAELFKSQVRPWARLLQRYRVYHNLQVYGTQALGLIIGVCNVCVGGALALIGIAM